MYLEPRTDVPALQDWSTSLILADWRSGARVTGWTAVVVLALWTALAVLAPAVPGTVATLVVLGLLGLLTSLGPLMARVETAPQRRGLLDSPWRRVSATVAADEDDVYHDRLILFDANIVVRGTMPEVASLVLDRQEVFVCGPVDGRYVIRVAGLCKMFGARVDDRPARPREREPHVVGRPLDDPVVARRFRTFEWGARAWLWCAVPAVVGALLVGLSLAPLSLPGLVVGGLLIIGSCLMLPTALHISQWYRVAAAGMRIAPSWTPVPVTLFPWEPDREVAGLAQLPGGPALLQFPVPDLDVIANIAETGTAWLAGSTTGAVAVGLPRVPALTVAVIQPDRDQPDDSPQPFLLRVIEPSLRDIPALRFSQGWA